MLKLFSWFGQILSPLPEADNSALIDLEAEDPCHLLTDAIDQKTIELDEIVDRLDVLLDQLYHCRTGTLASASWLAQPNESEEYRQQRIGAAAVQQTIRQLRNAAVMVKTTAITLRRPQQQAASE
mgnify:FL=1